jgi:hypothetical protein
MHADLPKSTPHIQERMPPQSSCPRKFVLPGTVAPSVRWRFEFHEHETEVDMGFGRGVLFWLLGVPIPIIILLALFWHH